MSDTAELEQPAGLRGFFERLALLREQRWMVPLAPLLFFFVTAFFAHLASIRGIIEFLLWFSDYATILLNIVVHGIVVLFFYSLTNRLRLSCAITFVLVFLLSLTHWMKMAILGTAFYPWDLALVSEAAEVMDFGCLWSYWPNLLLLLLVAPAVVIAWQLLPRKRRTRLCIRMIALVLCAGFFVSLFFPRYSAYRVVHDRILDMTWNQNRSYARAGVLLAFTAGIQNYFVEPPQGDYSADSILKIYASLDDSPAPQPSPYPPSEQPVNLILILGEAFWDPTVLPGVTFGSDPIPAIRRLGKEFGQVDLICPVYGGGTCDSELEVLSGCNMAFFPPGAAPYKYYIRQPLPSLASILRKRGYLTVSLHAVEVSYFNDCEVQPRLGFEVFHPATKWKHVEKVQHYVTDSATFREIARLADGLDKPFFISVNTMETHWPFPPDRYPNRTELADFDAPGLSSSARATLETYVCGVRRTDRALKELVEHFRDDPRPTMIVLYGDHLPALGEDYGVFRECGYWRDDLADPLRFRTVPAVFWNNFGLKMPAGQRTSMCYVSPLLLEMMGVPLPPFYRFLQTCKRQYPILSVSGCVDAAGRHVPLAEVLGSEIAQKYRLLQYDRVFGKQYFRTLAGPAPAANPQNFFDN